MTTTTPAQYDVSLRVNVTHSVGDAEPRKAQYSASGALYRPTRLTFTLKAFSMDRDSHPSYTDLEPAAVALHGLKIKKDGTPGAVHTTEHLAYEYAPDWARAIIDAELAELRAL